MRRFVTAALASSALACSASPFATAVVGLGAVPDGVESVVISVIDPEDNEVVASATVTPPLAAVELGVPAERPLVFRAIARTNRPGPRLVGGFMPSYVARAERTIPLGAEQASVDLLARPAGVLTVVVRSEDGDAELFIEDEAEARRPVRVHLDGQRYAERAVVLPVGRYDAYAEDFDVDGGQGLFVVREQESVAVLDVVREEDREGAPVAVRIRRFEDGAPCDDCLDVVTATGTETSVSLHLEALGEDLAPLELEDAVIEIVVEATPPTLVVRRPDPRGIDALPAVVDGLAVQGRGRLRIRAVVTTERGVAAGTFASNVGYPDDVAKDPVRLEASVADVSLEALARGTELEIALLDATDRYARSIPGRVDLSRSSPYLFVPDGRAFELVSDERGRLVRRIARPSAPRGVRVAGVVTVTSTVVPGTWTATVTFPLLELPGAEE